VISSDNLRTGTHPLAEYSVRVYITFVPEKNTKCVRFQCILRKAFDSLCLLHSGVG